MHICMCMHVCMYARMYVCMFVYIATGRARPAVWSSGQTGAGVRPARGQHTLYISICMCMCVYVCIYVYMHICIYI